MPRGHSSPQRRTRPLSLVPAICSLDRVVMSDVMVQSSLRVSSLFLSFLMAEVPVERGRTRKGVGRQEERRNKGTLASLISHRVGYALRCNFIFRCRVYTSFLFCFIFIVNTTLEASFQCSLPVLLSHGNFVASGCTRTNSANESVVGSASIFG